MKKRIKIFDTNFSHSKNALGYDTSSYLEPSYIEWVREGEGEGDVTFFTDRYISSHEVDSTPGAKIAWILEPFEYNPAPYHRIRENYHKFHVVLTYNEELCEVLPNALRVPFGGCWIEEKDWSLYEKTKLVSMISSNKKLTSGHLFRHEVFNICNARDNEVDFFGTINGNHIDNKVEGLRDYAYSIVIENDRSASFFTEKLIDCFMTGTIPIYWGCPNIDRVFNGNGIISTTKLSDFRENWISGLPPYEVHQQAIKDNFEIAKQFVRPEDWLWNNLLKQHFENFESQGK